MDESKILTRDDIRFIHPDNEPPPLGVKLIINTRQGICIIGKWDNESMHQGWLPLPKKAIRKQHERKNENDPKKQRNP